MQNHLPDTPAEVLDLSTNILKWKVKLAVRAAELFGYWRYPIKNAATAFEEMNLWDIYYWVYKSKNPILRMEKGYRPDDVLARDPKIIELPKEFYRINSVTMGAGGDVLYNDRIRHSKDKLFANIKDVLFDRDISYVNFESPITTQNLVKEVVGDKAPPIECCSIEQFDIVKGHQEKIFDIMNTSNNHIFDMGSEGIETTIKVLAESGVVDSGTISGPENYGRPKILVRNGIKIGFVAVTFGLNGHMMSTGKEYQVHVAKILSKYLSPDLDIINRQIDHCRNEKCDFIIASLHWGYEFEFFPRLKQIRLSQNLIEAGVDTIICHHPHVIQPVEYYRTLRDPNRIAVIAYSLGSLVWGFEAPHLALSLILNLKIVKGRLHGEEISYLENVNVTPVFQNTEMENGLLVTRIEKLSAWIAMPRDKHTNYINKMVYYAELVLNKVKN